ncbi:hypothetical protein FHG87_016449 [Trinorchestia longiramus]|nr:hypothetical protein FHG87_016449 [Trinorchestia longiramus]
MPSPKPASPPAKVEDQPLRYFLQKDKITSFDAFKPERNLQKQYKNLIISRLKERLVCLFMTENFSECSLSMIFENKLTLYSPLTLSAFKNGISVPLFKILHPNNGLRSYIQSDKTVRLAMNYLVLEEVHITGEELLKSCYAHNDVEKYVRQSITDATVKLINEGAGLQLDPKPNMSKVERLRNSGSAGHIGWQDLKLWAQEMVFENECVEPVFSQADVDEAFSSNMVLFITLVTYSVDDISYYFRFSRTDIITRAAQFGVDVNEKTSIKSTSTVRTYNSAATAVALKDGGGHEHREAGGAAAAAVRRAAQQRLISHTGLD